MIDKLKSPKVLATIAAIIVAVWVIVTGAPPPDAVQEAIENATGAEVDCDDTGKCSTIPGEGSGTPSDELPPRSGAEPELEGLPVTVPVDSDAGAQGNAELLGQGSGEGSGQ